MTQKSIYDTPEFFEGYLKQRKNPISVNEIIEKPTLLSLLPELREKRLLDLGCGTGEHLVTYFNLGTSFIAGLDLSSAMLNKAEENFAKNGINPTAYRLYHLPMESVNTLPDDQFDVITSSFAFHYVEDFAMLVKKIKTKLSSSGELIFSQEHPIVTCHKTGDRWEKNEMKQQIAYRLNHYREEGLRERNWFKQPFKTYHRTMSTIINTLIQEGFIIECVQEPMLSTQPEWHNEFKDLLHRPPLLFIKARLKK